MVCTIYVFMTGTARQTVCTIIPSSDKATEWSLKGRLCVPIMVSWCPGPAARTYRSATGWFIDDRKMHNILCVRFCFPDSPSNAVQNAPTQSQKQTHSMVANNEQKIPAILSQEQFMTFLIFNFLLLFIFLFIYLQINISKPSWNLK